VVGIAGFWFPDSVRVVEIGLSNGSQVPPWEITILNARYSVVSSGKDAIIYLFMATFVPYCPPLLVAGGYNCSNTLTIVGGDEYLLYYNGSRLYLLNLTGAINTPGASLEGYNGAVFVNGSWYLSVTIFNRNTEKDENRIYLFNPNEFCIKPLNVSWSALMEKAKSVNSINGWKIVMPFEKSPERWGPASVYEVCASPFEEAKRLNYPCKSLMVKSSGVIPIQIMLKKGTEAKNLTLAYLEMNSTNSYYRLSGNVVPIEVTACKKRLVTSTKTPTNIITTSTSTKRSICGPGLGVVLIIAPLIAKRLKS
jgi:hypothetical protein